MSKAQLAEKLERSQPSLNKLLYDLRLGKLTLKSIVQLTNALDVEISYLFEKKYSKREVNYSMWKTRIQKVVNALPKGAIVELNQILAAYWAGLSNPQKQQLGKWFYNDVICGGFSNVRFHHKNSANHAYYQIV
mgnify:FL=1|jgi:transcriptional regulator with XRE-family HTH domain